MHRIGPACPLIPADSEHLSTGSVRHRATRHVLASALLIALLTPFGAAALMQGRAASKAIVLDGQENFRSFRTASSEAGR